MADLILDNHLALENQKLRDRIQELELLAYRDYLTTLHNRRSFDEALNAEWSRACRSSECLSLIVIDLDNFKEVVDTVGHDEGSQLLAVVGKALAALDTRASDVVARYGGDEFMILLPDADKEGAHRVATAALEAIREVEVAKLGRNMTASVGVMTVQPEWDVDSTELVNGADRAMFRAKSKGRNQISE